MANTKSSVPKRYVSGVDKKQRLKDIEKRKRSKKPLRELFPQKSDREAIKKGKVKKSRYTAKFNRLYPDVPFDIKAMSKTFKIPVKTLQEVYDKGIMAWKTSGSRAGVSAIPWGRARLYKFILIELGDLPKQKRDPDNYLHKV